MNLWERITYTRARTYKRPVRILMAVFLYVPIVLTFPLIYAVALLVVHWNECWDEMKECFGLIGRMFTKNPEPQ